MITQNLEDASCGALTMATGRTNGPIVLSSGGFGNGGPDQSTLEARPALDPETGKIDQL